MDRFARAHDEAASPGGPELAGRYSALMPATPPGDGQQYAFEVDLDACSGCKSCVAACHAMNGLEEEESWRDVGLLHGGGEAQPVLQHWPLIVMLALTQMSVGAFLVEQVLGLVAPSALMASIRPLHSASALVFGLLALAVSVMHLGRPLYAFRAVIGLRHSWLSREIVAFGLFAGLAVTYAAWPWADAHLLSGDRAAPPWLGWTVAGVGVAGIGCSVMVYQFTQKDFWNGWSTGCKFLLTAAVLGLAAAWLSLMVTAAWTESAASSAALHRYGPVLCRALIAAAALKLVFEAALCRHLAARSTTSLKRTALLMTGALSQMTVARFAAGVVGGVAMPGLVLLTRTPAGEDVMLAPFVAMLFVACLAGELLERYLFFAAVASPKMPGGV